MAKGSRTTKGGKLKPAYKKTQLIKSGKSYAQPANGTGRISKNGLAGAKAYGLKGRAAETMARSNPGGGG